jgi:hypothetical protein
MLTTDTHDIEREHLDQTAQATLSKSAESEVEVPAPVHAMDKAYVQTLELYDTIARETAHICHAVKDATGYDYFSLRLTRHASHDFSDEFVQFAEEVVRYFKHHVTTVDAPLESSGEAIAAKYRDQYRKLCHKADVTSEEVRLFWLATQPSQLWRDLATSYDAERQRERTAFKAARVLVSYFNLKANTQVKHVRGKTELRINIWLREGYGRTDGRCFDGVPCEHVMAALKVFAGHAPMETLWIHDLERELSTYAYGRRTVVSRHKMILAQEVEVITYYESLRLRLPEAVATPLQVFIGTYGQAALTE